MWYHNFFILNFVLPDWAPSKSYIYTCIYLHTYMYVHEGKDEAIGSRGVIFKVLLAQVAGLTY